MILRPPATLARCAALAVAAIAALSAPAYAEVHALVVGIDAYQGPGRLRGAVNDANDIASALEASEVQDVTVLTDREATKTNVYEAWQGLVGRSKEGDLLIFHFSGHGISEPDDNGDETDGQDESYLFADYDDVENPGDRVVDDELEVWLSQAGAGGRKVLLIADACHSGSPTRSIFGESLPTRFYIPRTEPERPRPLAEASADAPPTYDYVFSVGATLDSHTVPEILIEDAPRGALSFAVARAFEGGADLDGDATVTASELEAFVVQNVRNIAASKQTPQFDIPDESFPIVRVIGVVGTDDTAPAGGTVRIHIRSGADQAFLNAIGGLDGVTLVESEPDAHLVFDPATGSLANSVRDLVAEELDLDGLKTAIAADRALRELQGLASQGTLPIAFTPSDEVHPAGTQMGFTVPSVGDKYLTVFDLTATGSVHFLWPTTPEDTDPFPAGRPFTLDAVVTPPFGADNLVVLATDSPPTALREALAQLDGKRDPASLIKSLQKAVAGQPYKIAIQAFFTRRE